MSEFDPRPMRRLEEREDIVDVLLSGYPIEPPMRIENFVIPGTHSGPWPQARLEIVAEFGKGEQVVYWDDAQEPSFCFGTSAYASRWVFAYVPAIETYFTIAFILAREPEARPPHPLASLFGGDVLPPTPMSRPRVDRMFVIRRHDAVHLADRFRPVIREDTHREAFHRIREWLEPYIPI